MAVAARAAAAAEQGQCRLTPRHGGAARSTLMCVPPGPVQSRAAGPLKPALITQRQPVGWDRMG